MDRSSQQQPTASQPTAAGIRRLDVKHTAIAATLNRSSQQHHRQQHLASDTAAESDVIAVLQTWELEFLEAWIKQHAADAAALGKPFMVEEFGKEVHLESGSAANISSIRTPFYQKVYQQLQDSLAADGPLKGMVLASEPQSVYNWLHCDHCLNSDTAGTIRMPFTLLQ